MPQHNDTVVFNIFPQRPDRNRDCAFLGVRSPVLREQLIPRVVSHADFGHYPKAGYDYILIMNERQGIVFMPACGKFYLRKRRGIWDK
jgi:hypothetical protein